MDSAIGFLLALIFLAMFVLAIALLYKNRGTVAKWLNTPYYAEDDRELKLTRRIQDAQRELDEIAKRKSQETKKE